MRLESRHYVIFALLTGALIGGAAVFGRYGAAKGESQSATNVAVTETAEAPADEVAVVDEPGEVLGASDDAPSDDETNALPVAAGVTKLAWPLTDAPGRVTKKPFGLFITPETSPVPGDRFSGIHVGVDFETTAEEAETDVPVFAICDGVIKIRSWANGYGGVATQECVIDGEKVTVIYGHLNVESIVPAVGQRVKRGDTIALLGAGGTKEVDGVRKHLHLGIRRADPEPTEPPEPVVLEDGTIEAPKPPKPDIRGYVKERTEMEKFMDALQVIGGGEAAAEHEAHE